MSTILRRGPDRRAAFFLLIFFLAAPSILTSETRIVDGSMTYRFRLTGDSAVLAEFYEYENESNSQRVIERGGTGAGSFIVVETRASMHRFSSRIPFPVNGRYEREVLTPWLDLATTVDGITVRTGPGFRETTPFVKRTPMTGRETAILREAAREITRNAGAQHEAVELIMIHIRENVSYRLGVSSNPVDVLRTGLAYCEGYANVAALLLRVLGIPVKVVDSYIPPGHMWGFGGAGSGGFHAHVEVYYDDAGWVSYDPQATVHYVDPYHIVRYPREGISRFQELWNRDETEILDARREPEGWDNFFQRQSRDERYSPVFTGKIIDTKGNLVSDSYRNNQWVYVRNHDGTGDGIRILPNGSFAVLPSPDGSPVSFFYRDAYGGWVEERLDFHWDGRNHDIFDLSASPELLKIDVSPAGELFLRFRDDRGRWRNDRIAPDPDRKIGLLSGTVGFSGSGDSSGAADASGGLKLLVSSGSSSDSPMYVLDPGELRKKLGGGGAVALKELPVYLDPGMRYLVGTLEGIDPHMVTIRAAARDGRTAQPVSPGAEQFVLPFQSEILSLAVLEGEGLLIIREMDFSGNPHQEQVFSAAYPDGASGRIEVAGLSPGTRFFLTRRTGNRYFTLGEGTADSQGRAVLIFPDDLPVRETLNLGIGSPVSRDMVEITADLFGSLVELGR